MTIVTIETLSGFSYPHLCVVYYREHVMADVIEIPTLPHGNSKQDDEFSKPYLRTNPTILQDIDNKLSQSSGSPSNVFYEVLHENGGPMTSLSPSSEPRNIKQVINRKTMSKSPSVSCLPTDLDKLIHAQRDHTSPLQTVIVTRDCYIAILYTKKIMKDIELFCCNEEDGGACVLGVDTTFKLCNMWITDTCYRNKRLLNARSRCHPVYTGPVMFHFSKDEETFRNFCLELVSANPNIINLKKVGVDMEAAIFNGFQSVVAKLCKKPLTNVTRN